MLKARLPGVRFESRLQPVAEDLPRMDIAALVGFATTGPLNLPVAIDDPGRFREIFGLDPELAWDPDAGRVRYGSLGGCVESFFANGGRRCWVVRAADAAAAAHHRFSLPGMAEGHSDGSVSEGVEARARAPGSWCEELSVGTRLIRELVTLRQFVVDAGEATDPGPLGINAGRYRLDLVADPAAFEMGELLEVFFGDDLPRLWLFVANIDHRPGFVRLCGDDRQSEGHTIGAYWMERSASSPEEAQTQNMVPVAAADALAALGAAGVSEALENWSTSPLDSVISVRRLRLELAVWKHAGLLARLGDLGFARQHPRCWARLPTDAALLGSPSLSRPEREPEQLDDDVSSPRFPLAGPHDAIDAIAAFYLPLAVVDRLDPDLAVGLSTVDGTPLERDGLSNFSASLFVDPALASVVGSLLAEAEHRYYVREDELIGLHSLLPVGEVSLLAIPDAHHNGWTRQLPPAEEPLGAPELFAVSEADEDGGYAIDWTTVAEATSYLLESGEDADFTNAVAIYDGADSGTTLYSSPGCPRRYYLRVRARRYTELGPWSNTRQALLPMPEFASCEGEPPAELFLALHRDDSPPERRLAWEALDVGTTGAERYELQESINADFVGAASILADATETALPEPTGSDSESEARRYFRVRGLRGDLRGPWSNTVIVEPTERVSWTLLPEAEYDDTVLLAVHRALLRFAAARADLFALLSLPRHYRAREAALHVGKLTAGGDERLSGGANTTEVPPLSFGENSILSYGALMHPWLTVRVPDRGVAREDVTMSLPPDGAVLGSMAGLAVERGAWLAPANRVLHGVLALCPRLDLDDWRQLTPARVNLVLQSPKGFLLFSEATLSVEQSVTSIHIRRLLILLRRLALREGDRFVFAPHDTNLQHLIRHRFEAMLVNLYSRGAFAGADPAAAFRVVTDETINPPASIERGRFIVELQIASARALAFITVRLVADERGRLAVEEV